MVVNPVNQKVYVTNTELPNHLRFEGAGEHGGSTVQGHLSESRITVIDPSSDPAPPVVVNPQHLNQHIDYSKLHTDVPDLVDPAQIQHSLATPLQPVVSSDGSTLYVPAFGSGKIGVFSTAEIEDPNFETNFDPTVESASYISTGGGPSGLALDEINNRLYVLTRFDNSVRVIDPGTQGDAGDPRAAQPRAGLGRERASVPLRRGPHLGQWGGLLLELPHLRRSRQPRLGPRRPRRRGDQQHAALGDGVHSADDQLPPDEGPDDDADAARPRDRGRHALARRPGGRLLRHRPVHPADRRPLQRGSLLPQLHRRLRRTGGEGRDDHAGPDAAVHGLRPADHASAEPGSRPRQLAHLGPGGRPACSTSRRPRTSSRPATAATPRIRPRASSAPAASRASRASRRTPRFPTCATPTRRSECSRSRGSRSGASASCTMAASTRSRPS